MSSFYLRLGEGELLLRLSLEMLLPLGGLLGLRLLDTLLGPFLGGLGDREYESDLPRLNGGPRPLLGEIDLERDRRGRRGGGERL